MNSLKDNKAFQTIVGSAVIYLGFVLWRDGWIEWIFSSEPQEGYSNGQLLVALGGALLSFVQLVGIATIGIVSGILPQFDGLFDWFAKGIKQGTDWLKQKLTEYRQKPLPREGTEQWDWRPIAAIVLAFFLWNGGQLDRIGQWIRNLIPSVVVDDLKPKGVVFFIGDDAQGGQLDVASSIIVDDTLDSANIERRMYRVDQNLTGEDDWVQDARVAAGDSTCLALWDGKNVRVEEIPQSIGAFIDEVRQW